MTKEDCYELGHITKTHGIKGELNIYLDVDDSSEYEDMDSVFLEIRGELVPYFIEELQIRINQTIIRFEDIDTFDKAAAMIGTKMFLPLDLLPELKGKQFYFHEVIGFQVVDKDTGLLGTVKEFYAMAAQDLMVMSYQGKEVLIPVNDELVLNADKVNKIINVDLPTGLVDL
jgi:16S rRNA processing protein RimM